MVVDFFEHFELRANAQVPRAKLVEFFAAHVVRGLAIGVHEMRIGRALMVHTQHGTAGFFFRISAIGIQVINVHAVMVITNAA